jgi:hypothetical protein
MSSTHFSTRTLRPGRHGTTGGSRDRGVGRPHRARELLTCDPFRGTSLAATHHGRIPLGQRVQRRRRRDFSGRPCPRPTSDWRPEQLPIEFRSTVRAPYPRSTPLPERLGAHCVSQELGQSPAPPSTPKTGICKRSRFTAVSKHCSAQRRRCRHVHSLRSLRGKGSRGGGYRSHDRGRHLSLEQLRA